MGNPILMHKASMLRRQVNRGRNIDKVDLEGVKINMNDNMVWRFVWVKGQYRPAKFAHCVRYDSGVEVVRVHGNYYEVSKEAGKTYLTQKRILKSLVPMWKSVKETKILFMEVTPRYNETFVEATKRLVPENLRNNIIRLPAGAREQYSSLFSLKRNEGAA